MNPQVEPPEKKTKSSSLPPSFSLLPDDITVNYLARVPRPNYPRLSTVSKTFRSLISSSELYKARYNFGTTEYCLYLSTWEANGFGFPQWFTLWINPNPTLHDSSLTLGNLLVPIPPTDIVNSSEAVVGSEIYVIGREINGVPSSVVRILDCRTHTWRDAASMNAARNFPVSCSYDGKIYVLGGLYNDEPWAEVFDTKTQTWECLPSPGAEIRKCHFSRIAEIQGKIVFGDLMSKEMYAYDTKHGKWEHCEKASKMFLSSQCVIENVSFSCRYDHYDGPFRISWYDIKVGTWKRVKGLQLFQEKHSPIRRQCDINSIKLFSCGVKLLLVWVEIRIDKTICCAEIKVEKCDEGEVWGKVEWDDVVLTIPTSHVLLPCVAVSV